MLARGAPAAQSIRAEILVAESCSLLAQQGQVNNSLEDSGMVHGLKVPRGVGMEKSG